MDLSVITVTWNCAETITEQIRSVVLGCEGIEFEQIIIDNNSSDNTVDLIKKENITLIENKENLGFAKANNQGFKESKGEYILLLNPDMKMEKGSIKKMIEYLKQNEDVGILAPKLVNKKGKSGFGDGPRRFPKFFEVLMMILKIPHIFPGVLNRCYYKDLVFDKTQEVESVRGAFMLLPREILEKIGYAFDERYYIWFDDVDLCREVKKLGKKVVYYPEATCTDLVGQSFKKRNVLWKQWNFFKSAFKYFIKWGI